MGQIPSYGCLVIFTPEKIEGQITDLENQGITIIHFDIKNFTELKSSPFAEISQQIKKDILKIEDIKKSSKNMIYEKL